MGHGHMMVLVGAIALALTAGGARAATPTLIGDAGGKRVLELEDRALNHAYQEVSVDGGKAILYVHENGIYADSNAAPVLVVDDDAVRHTLGGIRLATIDGHDVRHGKNGRVAMNYSHPDFCPTASDNRVYRVDGPELTRPEMVAVLYALKPEIFKLTVEEEAEQKKAMADAAAESDKQASADHAAMKWTVLNGHGPVEHINSGTITFAAKRNGAYPATFDYTKDGGATFAGVGVAGPEMSGELPIWVAYGTPKTIGLCVYKIAGGKLSGTWHTWYDDGTPKSLGTEDLDGAEGLDGDYKITAAKAPTTGAAYAGTVSIKPLEIVGAGDDEKPYAVTWTIGTAKVAGIGIRTGDGLYVATGAGADTLIAKLKIQNGTFNGDFFKLGSKEQGSLAATN